MVERALEWDGARGGTYSGAAVAITRTGAFAAVFVAGARGVTGLLLVLYARVVYPAWSHFAGQLYLETPTFGLPCPTTILTMGLLAGLVRPYPRSVFVVPILWNLVGVQAAFLLSVPQDLGLAVVAVAGLMLAWKAG